MFMVVLNALKWLILLQEQLLSPQLTVIIGNHLVFLDLYWRINHLYLVNKDWANEKYVFIGKYIDIWYTERLICGKL